MQYKTSTKIRSAMRRRHDRRQFQTALDNASPSMRQELLIMAAADRNTFGR